MKVVINTCFGGFGLSPQAEDLYAEKSGFKIYRYQQVKYKHREGVELYEKVNNPEHKGFYYTSKTDFGDYAESVYSEDSYWYSSGIDRSDENLVAVVELLGSEKSSGSCAYLKVVEIPDDVSWRISEYDGNESVEEDHRSWN